MGNIIKQIQLPNGTSYDINAFHADTATTASSAVNAENADKLGGHSFSDIERIVNGVIDTYVIPSSAKDKDGYNIVVGASTVQTSTTASILNDLTSSEDNNVYRLGDVILMGATSDGTKNFDRWVSNISGTGASAVITLDILETQVATHHHTFTPTIATSSKALTGATPNTVEVATVGSNVTVTNDSGTYLTSVSYSTDESDRGGYTIDLQSTTSSDSDAVAHSHSVNSHSHSITFNPTSTLVSRTASVYSSLSTTTFANHEHNSTVSVAGKTSESDSITYITGGSKETFVTSISDSTANSNTGGSGELTTNENVDGKSTSVQNSTDTVGSIVLTQSSGSHTHDVTLTTADNAVVTAASVATSVVTSVSYSFTAPSVASTVVTGVTYASKSVIGSASLTGTTTFLDNCTVNDSGVLIFTSSTVGINTTPETVASISYVGTSSQSSGGLTIDAPRTSQSRTLGKVTVSGSTESSGSHQHGFSHTHTIPAHTHTLGTHTHTYKKQVVTGTSDAYITLDSDSYTPHTHSSNVSVAGSVNNTNTITYVSGGDKTTVVRDLKNAALSGVSTGSSGTSTGDAYLKTVADITFPALKNNTKQLSTTTIAPAGEAKTVLTGYTFTSSNFVTGISGGNTSDNLPGTGN
jgi:hypothetical protein